MEGDAVSLDLRCQVGVVGDHQRNLGIQLARLPAPEQVDQAMPVLRDQDRHALGAVGEADPPVHPVLARQRGERGVELVPAQAEALALDLHPHEERAARWIAHMLVGAKDIAVVQGDEAGDRRDQAPCDRDSRSAAECCSSWLILFTQTAAVISELNQDCRRPAMRTSPLAGGGPSHDVASVKVRLQVGTGAFHVPGDKVRIVPRRFGHCTAADPDDRLATIGADPEKLSWAAVRTFTVFT